MARSRPPARIWAFLPMLLLAGCEVGPDFKQPLLPPEAGYARNGLPSATASAGVKGGEAQRFVQDLDIPGQWWALFHSQPLNQLVEQALRNNPDIDAARAALRQANENVYAGQGGLFPP